MLARTYRKRSRPQYLTVRVKPARSRKGYTYKKKDIGLPGRGPRIIPVEKGKLSKFGYSTKKSDQARRAALKKAVDEYGSLSVFRKLNAMVIMRKRTQPKARAVFEEDRDWVREQFKIDGFVS